MSNDVKYILVKVKHSFRDSSKGRSYPRTINIEGMWITTQLLFDTAMERMRIAEMPTTMSWNDYNVEFKDYTSWRNCFHHPLEITKKEYDNYIKYFGEYVGNISDICRAYEWAVYEDDDWDGENDFWGDDDYD